MGCKLSIGIKGDTAPSRPMMKVAPIFHEQATSPITRDRKDSTTNTSPPKEQLSKGIQKDYAEKETDYKPPDEEDNGTESKHSDSTNRWKSKTRLIGSIAGRRSGLKHRNRQHEGSR